MKDDLGKNYTIGKIIFSKFEPPKELRKRSELNETSKKVHDNKMYENTNNIKFNILINI